MKAFFTALALAAVLSFQALSPAAAAPYGQHEYGKGKNDGCMYEGYPCSEWSHSGEDSW